MQAVFEKNDIKISVISFKDFDTYESMFHSHMEIVYILSGHINVTIDAISKKLEKGQASITFPYSVHSYEKGKGAEGILVMFSLSYSILECFARIVHFESAFLYIFILTFTPFLCFNFCENL